MMIEDNTHVNHISISNSSIATKLTKRENKIYGSMEHTIESSKLRTINSTIQRMMEPVNLPVKANLVKGTSAENGDDRCF